MCGESPAWLSPVAVREGSPPHVWGKLRDKIGLPGRGGITPTCVGKAIRPLPALPLLKDHPHMCGESRTGRGHALERMGSPPHVWGKHAQSRCRNATNRITPTCVGKASMAILPLMPMKDHPHMCGESCKAQSTSPQRQGSPPHVWGKPVYWDEVTNTDRIIPTCVGKARYILQESNLIKDHPHMCGESTLQ